MSSDISMACEHRGGCEHRPGAEPEQAARPRLVPAAVPAPAAAATRARWLLLARPKLALGLAATIWITFGKIGLGRPVQARIWRCGPECRTSHGYVAIA